MTFKLTEEHLIVKAVIVYSSHNTSCQASEWKEITVISGM